MKLEIFNKKHHFTKLKVIFSFAWLIIGFLVVNCSFADTFYVSKNGSDKNLGTLEEPWLTITHAANIVGPGDTLYVRGGIYNEEIYLEQNGSVSARVKIKTYPGETVILDGQETRRWGFRIYGSYITIEGFTVRNYNRDGIRTMGDSHHIEVYHCTIHHIGWADRNWNNGIYAASNSHHHNFSHNEIYDIYNHPIALYPADDCVASYNILHDSGDPGLIGNGTAPSAGIMIRDDADGNWIHHNIINNVGNSDCGYGIAIQDGSDNNIVEQNISFHNPIMGIIINASDGSCHNNIIRNNIVYGNSDHFTGWGYGCGICINTGSGNKVQNNTIYGNLDRGLYITGSGNEAQNNIVSQNKGTQIAGNGSLISYSLIDGATSVTGSDYIMADPQFVDANRFNFHLKATSPAIDAGITLGTVTNDCDGNSRPNGTDYDIGAYEYYVASTDQTAPTASIILSGSSPIKAGILDLRLMTSKNVTIVPTPLILTEGDSSTTPIVLHGSVPNTIFTGTLIVDDTVAEGVGYFSLNKDALVDEQGNVGNEIILGAYIRIDRTPPAEPQNITVKNKSP